MARALGAAALRPALENTAAAADSSGISPAAFGIIGTRFPRVKDAGGPVPFRYTQPTPGRIALRLIRLCAREGPARKTGRSTSFSKARIST